MSDSVEAMEYIGQLIDLGHFNSLTGYLDTAAALRAIAPPDYSQLPLPSPNTETRTQQ
jgi:hypothetical protein